MKQKTRFLMQIAATLAVSGLMEVSAQAPTADTLLIDGKIYTANPKQPWAEAVAITDGKFSFVGSSTEAESYKGAHTRVISLDGKMAMPGINDLHVHPVWGFTVQMFECAFPGTSTPDDVERVLATCIEKHPDAQWIVGGQWETDFFVKHNIGSPRKWLDRVSGDKAVILRDTSFHNHWVNSKALALAGLGKNSAEIPGGKIVRDEATGEPNGLLFERAANPVLIVIPDWTAQQYIQAARESMRVASRLGITGMKEAYATLPRLAAYKAVDDDGEVNLHLTVCIGVDLVLDHEGNVDAKVLGRLRDEYRGRNVSTDCVKIMMDGVPSSSRTAAMLADYVPAYDGAAAHNGMLHYDGDALARLITQLDQLGITVKVHTAGDRAVRVTLDAIQSARKSNGDSGLSHELAHAGYIDDADIPRFAALNVVAEVSPYIWFPSPKTDDILRAVGERGEHYFPIKTLLESGVQVVAGSDWPAGALPDMNPWVGLEAMVSRRNPWEKSPGVLWETQAVSIEQALRIFISSGAKALRLENATGSIEAGKLADIIVLDQNLFEIPVERISDTQVKLTFFEGKVVYTE